MQDHYITYHISGRYTVRVRASSLEEAKELAEDIFCNADFGELALTNCVLSTVIDENNNVLYAD